jgi:hypothetical protein
MCGHQGLCVPAVQLSMACVHLLYSSQCRVCTGCGLQCPTSQLCVPDALLDHHHRPRSHQMHTDEMRETAPADTSAHIRLWRIQGLISRGAACWLPFETVDEQLQQRQRVHCHSPTRLWMPPKSRRSLADGSTYAMPGGCAVAMRWWGVQSLISKWQWAGCCLPKQEDDNKATATGCSGGGRHSQAAGHQHKAQ